MAQAVRLILGLAVMISMITLATFEHMSLMFADNVFVTFGVPDDTRHSQVRVSSSNTSNTRIQRPSAWWHPYTPERASVCLYGDIRFFLTENSTDVFAKELLSFLTEVALRSFDEAVVTSGKVHIMIPVTKLQPHFLDWQDLDRQVAPILQQYRNLQVDFSPGAYDAQRVAFGKTTCAWVVSVKLDADDILAPGYIDWIVEKVIPSLDRGAIVASRRLPRLHYGFDRCYANRNTVYAEPGLNTTCPYWSGWAVGQTRIFRRDVFEALGMPFKSDAHAIALSDLRSAVFTRILNEKPPSFLRRDFELAKDFNSFRATDTEMEKKTGIKMIESTDAGFGPAGFYMKSPLSSHFPFMSVTNLHHCSRETWDAAVTNATVLNTVKGNFSYMFDWGRKSNVTFYHMCRSSTIFQKDRMWHRSVGNATCEEAEHRFQTILYAAATTSVGIAKRVAIARLLKYFPRRSSVAPKSQERNMRGTESPKSRKHRRRRKGGRHPRRKPLKY